jgi:hypothetical protein
MATYVQDNGSTKTQVKTTISRVFAPLLQNTERQKAQNLVIALFCAKFTGCKKTLR